MAQEKKQSWFVLVFDVLFIMILCFATLLSTMLMRGSVIIGGGAAADMKYTFGMVSFSITFIGLLCYLYYVLKNSNKELRVMVKEIYNKAEVSADKPE